MKTAPSGAVFSLFFARAKKSSKRKHAKVTTGLNFAFAKFCTRFPLWKSLSI